MGRDSYPNLGEGGHVRIKGPRWANLSNVWGGGIRTFRMLFPTIRTFSPLSWFG